MFPSTFKFPKTNQTVLIFCFLFFLLVINQNSIIQFKKVKGQPGGCTINFCNNIGSTKVFTCYAFSGGVSQQASCDTSGKKYTCCSLASCAVTQGDYFCLEDTDGKGFGSTTCGSEIAHSLTCGIYTPQTSTGSGDPQYFGYLGQSFQCHGIDGNIYALLSNKWLQVNTKYKFINKGGCPISPFAIKTPCFTHSGSYQGEFAIIIRVPINPNNWVKLIGDKNNQPITEEKFINEETKLINIIVIPGEGSKGIKSVKVNGEEIDLNKNELLQLDGQEIKYINSTKALRRHSKLSSGKSLPPLSASGEAPLTKIDGADDEHKKTIETTTTSSSSSFHHNSSKSHTLHAHIEYSTPYEFILHTPHFRIRVVNSDNFFNNEFDLLDRELYIESENNDELSNILPLHGLVGQTVNNKIYQNQWRYIEGDMDSYIVPELISSEFRFSKFYKGKNETINIDNDDQE